MYLALDLLLLEQFFGYILTGLYILQYLKGTMVIILFSYQITIRTIRTAVE
jgi:hypothetical protein